MNNLIEFPIKTIADIKSLESTPLEDRNLPQSTYELLKNSAHAYEDKNALTFLLQGTLEEEPTRYSFRQLFSKITQTANAFNALGVTQDDCVSMLLPNLPQTHFTIWGAEAAGIFNPINPLLDVEHIVAILIEAKTKVLVTLAPFPETELWAKAQAVMEKVPGLEAILTVDLANFLPPAQANAIAASREEYLSDTVLDFDDYISQFNGDKLDSGRIISPDNIASYFHTGGTTGTPKLAPHTHHSEVVMAWQLAAGADIGEDYTAVCGLPLFHVNAVFVTGLAPWMVGAEALIATPQGYRNPTLMKNFWGLVEKYQFSFFGAVPTILSGLLEIPNTGYDLSSLKFCTCGAAPLSKALIQNFEQKTGLVILEGYGQTEGTCATSSNTRYGKRPVGSVGLPLPYMQIRIVIVDDEGKTIRDCETNESGEIAIKGPTVFKGYKQAEQNKGQWVDEGWFNTGDLGRLDEDGYLWLTGRSKDLIIRGGHNIDPSMIEEALHKHDDVQEVAAIGLPDARLGELPMAFVQLREAATTTTEELLTFASEHIQERAAVPKEIIIVPQMPLTAVGKIFKPDLRNDLIKRLVTEQLNEALESKTSFQVDVEVSKEFGQIVTILTSDIEKVTDAAKHQLSAFDFHYKVISV